MLACQLPTINSNWHHLYLCIAPLLLRFVTICSVAIIMADPVSIEGEQQQQASVYIYTEQEAHVLDGLEEEARRLFAPSVAQYCYQDVKSLKSAVESWSHSKGAHTSPLGQAFFCKRGDTPAAFKKATEKTRIKKSIPAEKHRARKTMRCGCEFVIRFAFASKAAIKLGVPAGAVRITPGSSYRHTNGCFPSQSQLIVDKKRAGAYQAQLNDGSLLSLMEVLRSGRPVPCAVLREMMRPLYPPSMAIYAKEVGNMRQKVNQLWTKQGDAMTLTNDSVIGSTSENPGLASADSFPAEYLSLANQCASDLLKIALNTGTDSAVIEAYFKELRASDPDFTYRIARMESGQVCGYVWQTSTMRADWEDYGNVLFLDAMKRQLNSVHWPYIGPCVLNSSKKVAVVAESICISERIDAYVWILRMIEEMSPRRQLSSLKVVFGDGIFAGGSLLTKLGIQDTCNLCQDTYHLLSETNGAWPRFFGPQSWPRFKTDFSALVYSSTKDEYMSRYLDLKKRLHEESSSVEQGEKWDKYFEASIHNHKHQFVRAYVTEYPFNLEMKGSAPAEANHSSFGCCSHWSSVSTAASKNGRGDIDKTHCHLPGTE
jgi:hypothetical protein